MNYVTVPLFTLTVKLTHEKGIEVDLVAHPDAYWASRVNPQKGGVISLSKDRVNQIHSEHLGMIKQHAISAPGFAHYYCTVTLTDLARVAAELLSRIEKEQTAIMEKALTVINVVKEAEDPFLRHVQQVIEQHQID